MTQKRIVVDLGGSFNDIHIDLLIFPLEIGKKLVLFVNDFFGLIDQNGDKNKSPLLHQQAECLKELEDIYDDKCVFQIRERIADAVIEVIKQIRAYITCKIVPLAGMISFSDFCPAMITSLNGLLSGNDYYYLIPPHQTGEYYPHKMSIPMLEHPEMWESLGLDEVKFKEYFESRPDLVRTGAIKKVLDENIVILRNYGLNPIGIQGGLDISYGLNNAFTGLRCFTKILQSSSY